MRLATYESRGKWRAGIVIDDLVIDVSDSARVAGIIVGNEEISNRTVIQWTPQQQAALEKATRILIDTDHPGVHRLQSIHLGPPVPDPEKIICLGLNYVSHAEEAGFEAPKIPILFAKFRNALTGSGSPIHLPAISEQIDYEGELAVVIGKRCKGVTAGDALKYVAGYMALNDVSARDLQFRTGQWLSGKSLDTFAPCGPTLVMNEIQDPQNLHITTSLNGQVMQQGNTCNMIFSVAQTIAYISQLLTLEPGDIIATGTPEGVGFKRNPPVFLHPGDLIEVEIEGIGRIRNPVIQGEVLNL